MSEDIQFEVMSNEADDSNFYLWESNGYDNSDKIVIKLKNITLGEFIDFLIFPKTIEIKSISSSINSIASTVFYNLFNNHKIFDISNYNQTILFDKAYSGSKKASEFQIALGSVLLMTYRNGMNNIYSPSGECYNTDCGWGCTIRVAQMVFAKALIEIKKFNFAKENNHEAQYMNILKFREEVVPLFNDKNMPISFVLNMKDYNWIFEKIKEMESNMIKNLPDFKTDIKSQSQYDIKAPYSIQTICHFTQRAGNYASSILIIQTLIEINKRVNNNIRIIHYPKGILKESEMYQTFGEEIPCTCKNSFSLLDISNDYSECPACSYMNKKDESIMIYNMKRNQNNHKKVYRFKYPGIIFVTIRLGLKYIEKEYIKNIKDIFQIQKNIGFIGGKADRAFYFIGYTNDQFLALDPHLNQDAIDISIKNNDLLSYKVKEIILIKPMDMSPEITFGVVITRGEDLINFLLNINEIDKDFIFIK